MTLRDRLTSLLSRGSGDTDADSESGGSDIARRPLEEIDVEAHLDGPIPEECPHCGHPVDAVVPPGLGPVDVGEHQWECHIGTRCDDALAGARVIHR